MKILKYWGNITMDAPLFRIIGGTCLPCPIGINIPVSG